MTSYIMYNILKLSVIWKIWRRGILILFRGEGGVGWTCFSSETMAYYCCCETDFKARYYSHTQSFKNPSKIF